MKDGWILNFLVNRIAIYLKRLMVFLLYIQSYQVVGISTRYKAVLVSLYLLEADGKEMVFLVPVCFCGAPIDAFCAVRIKNKRSLRIWQRFD